MTLRYITWLFVAALTSLAALSGVSSPAFAGGSLKDEPVAAAADTGRCNGGRFAGAYIGANIGYARHRDDTLNVIPGVGVSFGDDASSFDGGVHYGYNIQCDRLVFGVESDIGFFSADINAINPCCTTETLGSDINWWSTSRLRAGLVHENLLFYVTGGLAVADIDHTFTDSGIGFSGTKGDKQWGWTIGGGIEMLRDDNWMWRLEALYVDLGSQTETFTTGLCGAACTAAYKWEDNFFVARLGISYKFGAREEAMVPLK